jgi:pimeloyl-ACP methyl ester carboxylesterase
VPRFGSPARTALRHTRCTDRLAFTDTGTGPPVVLLHGLTCNLAYWLRVVPLLSDVRVVALDLRGHGLSGHRDSYAYADYAEDMFRLLDELDLDRVPVAGHSLGGYVALFAATRSDRIGAVLAIDVKSDWTEADAALADRSRDASQRVEPERAVLVERLIRTLPVALEPHELDELAKRSIESATDGWRFRWDRRVLATEPVDPFSFLGDVRCQTRVLAGAESEVMPPAAAERLAAAIPECELEILDGVGHHVELDAPGRVATRILDLVP